jgi:beta-glucosidase
VVVERLSDRVQNWITLNEPQCYMQFGHLEGIHAPGDKLTISQVLRAGHNTLLAHGKSFKTIQSYAKSRPNIGYAPVGFVCVPQSNTPGDILAAEKAMFTCEPNNVLNNTWWMDPVLSGRYPDDGLRLYEPYLPKISSEDMSIIQTDIDFLGLNIYHGTMVSESSLTNSRQHFPLTSFGWPVVPESLYWGPKSFYKRYKKPIMITENGMANTEWPSLDGAVHDPQRVDFMTRYLRELQAVVAEGVPVKGYFHWSLMDNFEWGQGFSKRFGLIYVDFNNQKRILKDSAHWYRNIIASNGMVLCA